MLRRDMLKIGLLSGVAPIALLSSNTFPDELTTGQDYKDFAEGPPLQPRPLGTHPATDAEDSEALKICKAAQGNTLIELTDWFAALPYVNKDGRRFNAAWPDRWNPVIVQFYYAASLPQKTIYLKGDTTPWCAAYLNWALNRLGRKGTGSASSGSFRPINAKGLGLGQETKNPLPGDLIVFKLRDVKDVGHGHVGVYVGENDKAYEVAGGNQAHGKLYTSINRTSIPKSGYMLELASFRSFSTIPLLTS